MSTTATAGEKERRGRGRPRDTGLQERIKTAALTVLGRHGFSGLTLDRVCAEAEVPKATFYRRWDHPTACVMEAYLEVWSEAEYKDTGSPPDDLEAFSRTLLGLYGHPRLGPCWLAVQAESRVNPEVAGPSQAGARQRRKRNTAAVQAALARLSPPPALSASVILNALNGVARNVHSLNWPISDEDLRILIRSLLSPAPDGR